MYMKRIITILILTMFLTGCGYDMYQMPEGVTITPKNNDIPVYSDTKLLSLIDYDNIEIISKNDFIKTNKIGQQKTTITYKFKNKKYKYNLVYNVVDITKPVLISYSSTKTIIKNDDAYFCEGLVYADDYDSEPECRIDGDYDLTKTGTYHVEYVISDSSDNETRKNLKINVVDKITTTKKPSTGNNTKTKPQKKYLYLNEVIEKHKNENTMIGIDVSRWQGSIDWEKVKNAGVEFVIMRIGVQSDYDKDISVDSYYHEFIKGAKDAGLLVGVYVYTTATNSKVAREHAKWVVKTLDGLKLDFPIAYDWENWNSFMKYKVSLTEFSNCFNTFYDEVNKHGYTAMLYSSKFYLENIWQNKYNRPVWLAHYTTETNYKGDYILWQMGNTGRIDGINGDVDIDIYYKNKTVQ